MNYNYGDDLVAKDVDFANAILKTMQKHTLYLILLVSLLFTTSCGVTKKTVQRMTMPELSEEEARRHDYFFLEATRQREM
ncbi:MAG: hypothetical protein IKU98_04980, partial [Bacteroidaceae bacterium]|nr:hypothetical protein [Bacteroidaceae bacterium]